VIEMRQTVIVAIVTATATAIVSIWGTSAIIAQPPKGQVAAKISSTVDVMRMMRESAGLPEERFDAH
jgi:hypothetical protein